MDQQENKALPEVIMLPQPFLERMEKMLGAEYSDFLAGFEKKGRQSLRVNSLKGSAGKLKENLSFLKEPVAWAEGGFYYEEDARPGKHPFHEAGVYYIQEASAMAPAACLNVLPGERILDLCASPGGKSTQIADRLKGQGLLVSNEIHPQRAKILSENIERMGIRNALVISHEPAFLAERFSGYFDKIIVDAPCSGEGMFRKNEAAALEWSLQNVELCARRQDEIMNCASVMLKPGGRMIYSTCTFAPEEDEGTVSRFLKRHPDFELEALPLYQGMAPGSASYLQRAEDAQEKAPLAYTRRIWPHRAEGEGHFVAGFKKEGCLKDGAVSPCGQERGIALKECKEWQEFKSRFLKTELSGVYLKFGDQLYLAPEGTPSLKGLKVLRPGLHLGTLKKNRFEPAHALALALDPQDAVYRVDLSAKAAAGYLEGRTFEAEGEQGWYLITVEGYSLGWGKLAGSVMKNHYPKGLRKQTSIEKCGKAW